MTRLAVTFLFALLSACTSVPIDPSDPSLVVVVDEQMSKQVAVRSAQMRLSGSPSDVQDHWLRFHAGIDRASGATVYLVEHQIRHRLGKWMFPTGVDYMNARGEIIKTSNFKRESGDVQNCFSSGCTYIERSTFAVSERDLRDLAVGKGAGGSNLWRMRIFSRLGYADLTGDSRVLAPFMARVDQLKSISSR